MATTLSKAVAAPKTKTVTKSVTKSVKPMAKPVVKATPKPAEKALAVALKSSANPVYKPVVKSIAKAAAPAPQQPVKVKKLKLVRDSFTIPKLEYLVIDELKQRAAKLAHPVKKSELLRAGIKALAAMNDAALKAALQAVPAIKTGRPKN